MSGEPADTAGTGRLFSFRVEFSLQCPRCDHPLPLDGPLEVAHCNSCQSDIEIPRDYWTETLESSCRKMQEAEIGTGTGSILIGSFHGHLTLARFDPYCDSCKTDFVNPWELVPGTAYTCRECGMVYPVQEPPSWLTGKVPRISLLVNALLSVETSNGQYPGGMKPVSMTCPSCSGQLEVDGSSRFVSCRFCNGQVFLPDDLWLRFHGTKRKRRWFVISECVDEDE
jgi:hypothetical protein